MPRNQVEHSTKSLRLSRCGADDVSRDLHMNESGSNFSLDYLGAHVYSSCPYSLGYLSGAIL
jgi:hypothetical protein